MTDDFVPVSVDVPPEEQSLQDALRADRSPLLRTPSRLEYEAFPLRSWLRETAFAGSTAVGAIADVERARRQFSGEPSGPSSFLSGMMSGLTGYLPNSGTAAAGLLSAAGQATASPSISEAGEALGQYSEDMALITGTDRPAEGLAAETGQMVGGFLPDLALMFTGAGLANRGAQALGYAGRGLKTITALGGASPVAAKAAGDVFNRTQSVPAAVAAGVANMAAGLPIFNAVSTTPLGKKLFEKMTNEVLRKAFGFGSDLALSAGVNVAQGAATEKIVELAGGEANYAPGKDAAFGLAVPIVFSAFGKIPTLRGPMERAVADSFDGPPPSISGDPAAQANPGADPAINPGATGVPASASAPDPARPVRPSDTEPGVIYLDHGFHFGVRGNESGGLKRSEAGKSRGAEKVNHVKTADGKVDPSTAQVHLYMPDTRPEVEIVGGADALNIVKPIKPFRLLDVNSETAADLWEKIKADNGGQATTAQFQQALTDAGFDGIAAKDLGTVQIFRDIAPEEIGDVLTKPVWDGAYGTRARQAIKDNGLTSDTVSELFRSDTFEQLKQVLGTEEATTILETTMDQWAKTYSKVKGVSELDLYRALRVAAAEGAFDLKPTDLAQVSDRQATGRTTGAERGERVTNDAYQLDPEQAKVITAAAKKAKLDAPQELERIRSTLSAFPEEEGWTPLTFNRFVKDEDTGKTVAEFNKIKWGFPYKTPTGKVGKGFTEAEYNAGLEKVSSGIVALVRDVDARAEAGDPVAKEIGRHSSWYKDVAVRLRSEFGANFQLMGDLLAALSPRTDVPTNANYAVVAIRNFMAGKYKAELTALAEHLNSGKGVGTYEGPVILRDGDKKYGMNSRAAMVAMLDLWRKVEPGAAPKAKTFGQNLIGTSSRATIDVWASRTIRRLLGLGRIAPPAEQAVSGEWVDSTGKTSGEFGFGQEAFEKAAKELGMDPHDLQAKVWFIEKALWTEKNWTNDRGEGGSFDGELDTLKASRLVGGISQTTPDFVPGAEQQAQAAEDLHAVFNKIPGAIATKVKPNTGLYAYRDKGSAAFGGEEPSFDVEVVAGPGFDRVQFLNAFAEAAKQKNQDSAFVARVLKPGEASENASPGLEIFFKGDATTDKVRELSKKLTEQSGVPLGFSEMVDPRSGRTVGMRSIYLGLFDDAAKTLAGDADPSALDGHYNQIQDKLDEMVELFSQDPDVMAVDPRSFDAIVMSRDGSKGPTYDEVIQGNLNASGTSSESGTALWPQLSRREQLQAAAQRGAEQSVPGDGGAGVRPDAEQLNQQGPQGVLGTFRALQERSRGLITLMKGTSNVSTAIHELGHFFEMTMLPLRPDLLEQMQKNSGFTHGSREFSEWFARQAEKFYASGEAPSGLEVPFAKLKTWMTSIYHKIAGTPLEQQLNPAVRNVFRWASGENVPHLGEQDPGGLAQAVKETVMAALKNGVPIDEAMQQAATFHLNLSRLATTDEVQAILYDLTQVTAAALNSTDGAYRSHDRMAERAAAFLGEPQKVVQLARQNAETLATMDSHFLALRTIRNAMAQKVHDLAVRLATDGPNKPSLELELALSWKALENVNFVTQRIQTGIARGLNAMAIKSGQMADVNKVLSSMYGNMRKQKRLADAAFSAGAELKELTGPQAPPIVDAIINTPPKHVPRFIRGISRLRGNPQYNRLLSMYLEYRAAALLSGLKTFSRNVIGNVLNTSLKPLNRIVGSAVSGDKTGAIDGALMYYDLTASAFDSLSFFADGLERPSSMKSATSSFVNEQSILDEAGNPNDRPMRAIPGAVGRGVRLPLSVNQSMDEFFKQMNYRAYVRNTTRQALRELMEDGRIPLMSRDQHAKALQRAVNASLEMDGGAARDADDVPLNPDAVQYAREATFTQELLEGTIGSSVLRFANTHQELRIVLPFIRVPVNILRKAWQLSPGLNLLQTEYRERLSSPDHNVRAEARGEMAVGTMLWTATVGLALGGMVTGGGPKEPERRNRLRESGWLPYSFAVPQEDGSTKYVSYMGIEPLSSILGLAGDFADASGYMDDDQRESFAAAAMLAFARNVSNKSYMKGVSELVNWLSGDETKVGAVARNFAASHIPSIVGTSVTSWDDSMREPRTVLEALKARIPVLADSVSPKRDLFGQPVEPVAGFVPFFDTEDRGPMANVARMISPLGTSTSASEQAKLEIARLATNFSRPSFNFQGLDLRVLTSSSGQTAYDRWLELMGTTSISGKSIAEAMNDRIASTQYQNLPVPDGVNDQMNPRVQAIQEVLFGYRQKALGELLKEFPAIKELAKENIQHERTGRSPSQELLETLNKRY